MSFLQKTVKYLKELESYRALFLRSGEATAELSYRPSLDAYFKDIASCFGDGIERVFEPKSQGGAGRPDWRFHDGRTLGVYGFIEAKPLSDMAIDVRHYLSQIQKYLSLGHRVILTDGAEFVFFDPEEKREISRVSLTVKSGGKSPASVEQASNILEAEFRKFFKGAKSRRVTEKQLIGECAIRARYLADEVRSLVGLAVGSGRNRSEDEAIKILQKLREVTKKHHDPQLGDEGVFADFVAQVLVFGLIYAHRVLGAGTQSPVERYEKLKNFWGINDGSPFANNLKPFQALAQLLHENIGATGSLGIWYEDCAQMLAHVELRGEQTESPSYHELFERFLTAFNPRSRFDYGAFYTPFELASYAVSFAEQVVSRSFGGESLYAQGNRLIDPCCGTGAFLEALLRASASSGGDAEIVGFEILPAPYALAHYRIVSISPEHPNVRVILTNTLSDTLEYSEENLRGNLLEEEQQLARDAAKPPLTLVIGNPPSSDSAPHSQGENFKIIQALLEDFRPPKEERTGRQNTQKQLQNEFVKFLRWAANKAVESENSVIALILPLSLAESRSYAHVRRWILANFSELWILEIDQDARTGTSGQNLFETLQGRLLMVAVRKKEVAAPAAKIFYQSISNKSAKQKRAFLSDSAAAGEQILEGYEVIPVDCANPIFRPAGSFDRQQYSSFWSLCADPSKEGGRYVFDRHCSGMKLAPSSLLVHVDEKMLIRRSMDISKTEKTPSEILGDWYAGQDKPPATAKFSAAVRGAFEREMASGWPSVKRYSYRPFLDLYALISAPILKGLSSAEGSGTRDRPEIRKAFSDPRTFGIAVAPNPKDLGEGTGRLASFCWNLPDNDLSKRGNAHVFCNWFPQYKKGQKKWEDGVAKNVGDAFLAAGEFQSPDEAIFYVYSILCSESYAKEFPPNLIPDEDGGSWPRIPLAGDGAIRSALTGLGRQLAYCEKRDDSGEGLSLNFRQVLSGYKGKEVQLESWDFDSENESLVLEGKGASLAIPGVPRAVLEFSVGGYRVLQQWLKMYKHVYTRKDIFDENQMRQLLLLLQSISEQLRIIKEVDTLVSEMLSQKDFR